MEQALTGLDAYYAKYEQDMASVSTGITDIRQDIADTKSQIGSTQQVITDLLNEIETKNVTRQEELKQKLSQVSASIEDTREQMKQMEETVVEAISNLKEEVQDNQKELVELLADLKVPCRNVRWANGIYRCAFFHHATIPGRVFCSIAGESGFFGPGVKKSDGRDSRSD